MVRPPIPCSTMRDETPDRRMATAWPSSCTSTDTSTTPTQIATPFAVPRLAPRSAAMRKKPNSTRTGTSPMRRCTAQPVDSSVTSALGSVMSNGSSRLLTLDENSF